MISTHEIKQLVMIIPPELIGKVNPNGDATIDTSISLRINRFILLNTVVESADTLINTATTLLSTTPNAGGVSLNLNEVTNKLNLIKRLSTLAETTYSSNLIKSQNGGYLYANIDDGMVEILVENLIELLNDLNVAVQNVNATGSGTLSDIAAIAINGSLTIPKQTVSLAIKALNTPLVDRTKSVLNTIADAAVFGDTSVEFSTIIKDPDISVNYDAGFVTTMVKTNLIDVSLLSSSISKSYIHYGPKDIILDPVVKPIIGNIEGNSTSGYTISGTGNPGQTIEVRNQSGVVVGTGVVSVEGTYSITIDSDKVSPDEIVDVVAIENGRESDAVEVTIPKDVVVEPITKPVVDEITGNTTSGYTISGTGNPGQTIEVRNQSGVVVGTGVVNPDGTYSIAIDADKVSPDEIVDVIAIENGRESAAMQVSIPEHISNDHINKPSDIVRVLPNTGIDNFTIHLGAFIVILGSLLIITSNKRKSWMKR